MRVFLAIGVLLVGFLPFCPVFAQLDFQEPPTEQVFTRPGEHIAHAKPASSKKAFSKAVAAQHARVSASPQENGFYLRKQNISVEEFNQFKVKVAEILKSGYESRDALSEQLVQAQIKQQATSGQIMMLKRTLIKVTELLAQQAQASGGDLSFRHMMTEPWFWAMLAVNALMLLLLAVYLYLFSQLKKKAPAQASADLETGGDYDFLSDPEGLPSYLDLAQAYIAMDDHIQARKALETVVLRDKGALRKQALLLLKTLPEK